MTMPYKPPPFNPNPIDTTQLKEHLQPKPSAETKIYGSLHKFLQGGYHTLLHGMTGAGKTTLVLTLLKWLHQHGHRILYRDDGGLEFLHLAGTIPMQVWIPKDCTLDVTYQQKIEDPPIHQPQIDTLPNTPGELLDKAYHQPPRFHVIVYDAYCLDPALSATFYSNLFKELIYRSMQTSKRKKKSLVFSFDELNDLIQPKGHSLTKTHGNLIQILSYNIRKLRKHRVTLLASSHRFNQLNINVRSQFSYIMIKRSYGKDVIDFMSNNLVSVSNDVFWHMVNDIQKMHPKYVYVFDPVNNYDKLIFPDIPRLDYDDKKTGLLETKDLKAKQWDDQDLYIALARSRNPPKSYRNIAEELDISPSTVHYRVQKLKKLTHIKEKLQ